MNIVFKAYCRIFQTGFKLALPIMPYRFPTQLNSLEAVAEMLESQSKKTVLLVADGVVRDLGLTKTLEDSLNQHNIKAIVYEQRTPNPTIANVEEARGLYIKDGCEAIIVIGGGSAMDCGKAVGARIACPNKPIPKMKGILHINRKTPLTVAIPTTAGTGSEATLTVVITDEKTHHKYPINDFTLIPDYAALDSELTVGLPRFVTATTGLDALTHAVEAYIGRSTTKETRALCEDAVGLIYDNIREAVNNGTNRDARRNMLRASFCAGAAFTRSYVGYVHGIAHSLGGQYGTAHGLANAVILPFFLREYGDVIVRKLAKLSRLSVVRDNPDRDSISDGEAAERFITWVESLNAEFGVPTYIEAIREEDIPTMAKRASAESNPLYPVPRLMDAKELEVMYRRLMKKAD